MYGISPQAGLVRSVGFISIIRGGDFSRLEGGVRRFIHIPAAAGISIVDMGRHYVQFYKADEPLLNRSVGQYLWEGMLRGDGLLVIAAEERRESLAGHLQRMGVDVAGAVRDRQLGLLDVRESLARWMPG